jgi:hypothetical protein
MKNNLLAIFLIAALNSTAAWGVEGKNLSLAVGFEYSSGNYGLASNTNILIVPVEGIYRTGPWALKVTIPYIWITGHGGVLPKGIRMKAAPTMESTTIFGMGDVEMAATYNIFSQGEDGTRVDFTGKVKFGSADKNLGTGENDYAAQVSFYRKLDRFTPAISLGYETYGSPVGVKLNNAAYGILGGDYQIAEQRHAGFEFLLAQKNSADGAGRRELTAYLNQGIGNDIYIRGYVLKGFSDGSPDGGFGVKFVSYY